MDSWYETAAWPSGPLRLLCSGLGILAVLLLPAYCANAQKSILKGVVKLPVIDKHDLRFTSLSVNGGSLRSRIHNIVQDNYGFLWLGTFDGLYRYDGYK